MTTEYRPLLTAADALAVLDRAAGGLFPFSQQLSGDTLAAHAYFTAQAAEIETLRMEVARLERDWHSAVRCEAAAIARAEAAEALAARLSTQVDALLAHCPDGECWECGRIVCPEASPHHFHHDGCPACEARSAVSGDS